MGVVRRLFCCGRWTTDGVDGVEDAWKLTVRNWWLVEYRNWETRSRSCLVGAFELKAPACS